MERYLRRNRLAEVLDGLGLGLLFCLLATGWFTWLWGLSAPSLLAGAALGTLLWTARSQWRRRTVARREKALRRSLGAELMLEAMLLAEAQEAHQQAVRLLTERWPIHLEKVLDEGALCRQGEETLLIQCLRMPPEGEVGVGDLLAAQRAVRRVKADRAVLCVMGKIPAKAAARAEEALIPLRLIGRETLLQLAGQLAPATDEQLVALGRRRRRGLPQGSLARLVFRREKARRYHLYGIMMLCLYILTGMRLYAVPGMVCLTMAVCSRCGKREPERL